MTTENSLPQTLLQQLRQYSPHANLQFDQQQRLSLSHPDFSTPLVVDFLAADFQRRWRSHGHKPITSAVGARKGKRPHVIDCTAGLGRDGFLLALYGCQVTMLERHPIVHALLADGLRRAANSPELKDAAAKVHLLAEDASNLLQQEESAATVAYIDPMFPPRGKAAKVKQAMQWLQQVVGADQDQTLLMQAALANHGLQRVVVKRHGGSPLLGERPPDLQMGSAQARFDVYLRN